MCVLIRRVDFSLHLLGMTYFWILSIIIFDETEAPMKIVCSIPHVSIFCVLIGLIQRYETFTDNMSMISGSSITV